MSAWDMVLIGINSIACFGVIWSVLCATNNMSRRTPTTLRLAFILLGIGAFASLLAPAFLHRAPTPAETALCLGVAILSFVDRRRVQQKRLAGHRG